MKQSFRLISRVARGGCVLGLVATLSGSAHAQIGQLAAPVLSQPVFQTAKPGPGGTLILKDGATVLLNQRGGYLTSAVVMAIAGPVQHPPLTVVSNSSTAKATGVVEQPVVVKGVDEAAQLLGTISGFGQGMAQPLAAFLNRPDVVQRLPAGVHVMADPFVIGAQTQGKLLRLTIAPQQVPENLFGAASHVQVAKQPGVTPVMLRVYSDFQCPYCEQFESKTYPGLVAQLPADVSVEFHQFPLESIHPLARPAAEASECAAQQGQFWPFKEALFTDRSWLSDNPNKAFIALADRLGLKSEPFKECLAERGGKAAVDASIQEALKIGINATPTVFVNGFRVGNPYDTVGLLNLMKFARAVAGATPAQLNPPLMRVPTPVPTATPKQP